MDTDEVLTLLREVADEVVNPRFRTLTDDQIVEKNPGDLVTVADREAEVLITAALQASYPAALVLGEEAAAADERLMDRYLAADHAFTVDPVDGTKNFVHGSPDHAVMVAETIGGETVRGWIWQPEHEVAWVAERGAGTWRDGVRVQTVSVPDDREPQGVTSMWSMRDQRLGELPPMRLSWVCCGVDYPKLVEGEADYAIYGKGAPWDHAPGSLILGEAGGYVGTSGGETYHPQRPVHDGLVAAADRTTYDLVQGLISDLPGF